MTIHYIIDKLRLKNKNTNSNVCDTFFKWELVKPMSKMMKIKKTACLHYKPNDNHYISKPSDYNMKLAISHYPSVRCMMLESVKIKVTFRSD
jgi:hypothetical protein